MITQFTNTCHDTAPFGIFAGRRASITSAPVEQLRFVADVCACPIAAYEMTTPVANFWKQLTGGTRPPAPEPLPLT